MKKLISLLLALILICSLIPMTTMAASEGKEYVMDESGKWYEYIDGEIGPAVVDANILAALNKGYEEYLASLNADKTPVHTDPRDHKLGWNSNTKYHWKECACGARFGEELHVDPKDAEDDYCICGYHFSSNADLVTLWVNGCPGIKNFNKNKTEYELKAYTYKDVKEIKISTRTHDSQATVELPEDLTLKEGENTFEVKVTAENQKVTKTYTLTIIKESK